MKIDFRYKHIRFLGSEGIGMSALIKVIQDRQKLGIIDSNVKISRSDLAITNDPITDDIDLVVRSTAITAEDPDYQMLAQKGVEFWHRSDMLAYLSKDYQQIVVTGTHGKTSCSAMISHLLYHAGVDPSFVVGGLLSNYRTNAYAGTGEYFVIEGDESDQSYLKTNPHIAVITSVEPDHLENYPGGYAEIQEKFISFLRSAKHGVLCLDDAVLAEAFAASSQGLISYSTRNPKADLYADPKTRELRISDRLAAEFKLLAVAKIELLMPGEYNLANALAAIATAILLEIPMEKSLKALKEFRGIKRRFELINESYSNNQAKKIKVYDDYAHHPTEVRALMKAALGLNPKRLVFVYQPHHPRRTQDLWNEFKAVFSEFPKEHLALLADIYVARTGHIEGITSKQLVYEIACENVRYLDVALSAGVDVQGNYADIVSLMKPLIDAELHDEDVLMIVGAGNITKVAQGFR